MVCPCLAIPLLVGGAVGSVHKTDLIVFSLAFSLIVVLVLILRKEDQEPCESCNAFL
jgi:hypothetical protein